MYCTPEDGHTGVPGNGEGNSACVSGSRSFASVHSLHATGQDPYDKLKYRTGEPILPI